MARLKPLSGIIAVQEWYEEKLSYAEAEYRTAAAGLAKSPNNLAWKHLKEIWKLQFSSLVSDLERDIVQAVAPCTAEVVGFGMTFQKQTRDGEFPIYDWDVLNACRQEQQALQRCKEMTARTL